MRKFIFNIFCIFFLFATFLSGEVVFANVPLIKSSAKNIQNISLTPEAQAFIEQKKDIIALYNSNNLQSAYQLIASIPEDERDAEMWLILANITQDYDKEFDSIALLQKSIQKDSKYYKAYYNLGNIYFKDNKLTKAVQYYNLALKYNKGFPYVYYNLGCCYLKDAYFPKAKSYFLKAIKLKSDEPNFYYNLAITYKKMNKNKMAQKALDAYNSLQNQ